MVRVAQLDQALIKMPSFKAVRSFVAAARYGNLTRAAQALCVTPTAVSRQIRELEQSLGAELFVRTRRGIELTPAGANLFDAVQLSFLNIFQATERIRQEPLVRHPLTLCCSPALSAMRLCTRLRTFLNASPDVDLNVITTQNFLMLEPGVRPDIFITQTLDLLPGYRRIALFHERVYPVCTPAYLDATPGLNSLAGLHEGTLLDLKPYGRSQMTEHLDWNVWLALHSVDTDMRCSSSRGFSSNDYHLLMQMVLENQGVALGWHHLVGHLVADGRLVRPVEEELALQETTHYLIVNEAREKEAACAELVEWLLVELSDVQSAR